MHIYTHDQIKKWDQFTLEEQNITSQELMYRAANALFNKITKLFPDTRQNFHIHCGTGNNGGDGLVIAELLYAHGYDAKVIIHPLSGKYSEDFKRYHKQLLRSENISLYYSSELFNIPLSENPIAIDAIIGAGFNRDPDANLIKIIDFINKNYKTIISIDIPTGISTDNIPKGPSIKADYTLSLQAPKLSFMFEEVLEKIGELDIVDIGLSEKFKKNTAPHSIFLDGEMISKKIKKRKRNTHKYDYGCAELICGSSNMQGAALLAARSCMRSGVGLLYCHFPKIMKTVLPLAVPEAIGAFDVNDTMISQIVIDNKINAIGIGCGLGMDTTTQMAVSEFLTQTTLKNVVLDADALNIISLHKAHHLIKSNWILTPHPGEFRRLFGDTKNSKERLKVQVENSLKFQIYIICKTHHTTITTPEGRIYFNSTGNPGMATAGSGDILTGLITGLLAQGYSAEDAALMGVYLHGLAGDLAAHEIGQEALVAADIIDKISAAFKTLCV